MKKIELAALSRSNEDIYVNYITEPMHQGPHIHDFIELEYVLSGSGVHQIGEQTVAVRPGDVFFTNRGTSHCFLSADQNHPITVYNCLFSPQRLGDTGLDFSHFTCIASELLYQSMFPEEIRSMPYIHVYDSAHQLRRLLEVMHEEYTRAEEGYGDLLLGGLIQVLAYFLRLYKRENKSLAKQEQDRYLMEVLSYIEENYSGHISLGELARVALLSPNHLCKVFKETTGSTISEYVQKLRLERVCTLLRETNRKLADISGEVGYLDEGYLRRLFKKEYGCTPSEYRRASENQHPRP